MTVTEVFEARPGDGFAESREPVVGPVDRAAKTEAAPELLPSRCTSSRLVGRYRKLLDSYEAEFCTIPTL